MSMLIDICFLGLSAVLYVGPRSLASCQFWSLALVLMVRTTESGDDAQSLAVQICHRSESAKKDMQEANSTAHFLETPTKAAYIIDGALQRIGHLEHIVTDQQTQLNELVPVQQELITMIKDLEEEQMTLREQLTALCDVYDSLLDAGLVMPKDDRSVKTPRGPPAAANGVAAADLACHPEGARESLAAPVCSPQIGIEMSTIQQQQHDIYVVGGRSPDLHGPGAAVDTVEMYSSTTRCWESAQQMEEARVDHRVVGLLGALYVVGGLDTRGSCLTSCERLRPNVGRWETLPPMSVARANPALAIVADELCVTGGTSDGRNSLATCERFSPSSGSWSPLPSLLVPRVKHTALSLQDNLYVVGGKEPQRNASALAAGSNCCELLEKAGTRWTSLPPLPVAQDGVSATIMAGKLFVVSSSTNKWVAAECHCFDPQVGHWERLPQNEQLHVCAEVLGVVGSLYVFSRSLHQRCVSGVHGYDPRFGQWEELPSMPAGCSSSSCQAAAIGKSVYAIGRRDRDDFAKVRAKGWAARFDPLQRQWHTLKAPTHVDVQVAVIARSASVHPLGD